MTKAEKSFSIKSSSTFPVNFNLLVDFAVNPSFETINTFLESTATKLSPLVLLHYQSVAISVELFNSIGS
jgi:hypothetical protein